MVSFSVFDDEKDAEKYIDNFNQERRFFRESTCERVSSFDTITVEDCKNNSIEDFNKILSLQKAMNGDMYLTRNEVIELVNSILSISLTIINSNHILFLKLLVLALGIYNHFLLSHLKVKFLYNLYHIILLFHIYYHLFEQYNYLNY